jgi:hypothetical protein
MTRAVPFERLRRKWMKDPQFRAAYRSRLLKSIHSSAKQLHKAGYISDADMRDYDALCPAPRRRRA